VQALKKKNEELEKLAEVGADLDEIEELTSMLEKCTMERDNW
jgi:hypothetical protein